MEALLKLIAEQTGVALLLLGVLVIVFTWVPFTLNLEKLKLTNPATRKSRNVLSFTGTAILVSGFYLAYAKANENPVFEPTLVDYISYISLNGTSGQCAAEGCLFRYFTSGEFRAPWPKQARYVGHIKTSGRIDRFRSIPPYDTLNPEQYPRNPTYLQFAISPRPGSPYKLNAQTDLTLHKRLSAESGKVGAHLPYFTKKATMIVDFRPLGFSIAKQISARIESPDTGGILRTGLIDPVRWDFADGKVVSVSAADIPANSSLVLEWGE